MGENCTVVSSDSAPRIASPSLQGRCRYSQLEALHSVLRTTALSNTKTHLHPDNNFHTPKQNTLTSTRMPVSQADILLLPPSLLSK